MCPPLPASDRSRHWLLKGNALLCMAALCGVVAGLMAWPILDQLAEGITAVFINLLKLVSLPIIFLSIVSTVSGMDNIERIKTLGFKVIKYTLLTTVIAATSALLIFQTVQPVRTVAASVETVAGNGEGTDYLQHLLKTIPSNVLQPFVENNVVGVLILAFMLSAAILSIPCEKRKMLHNVFSGFYAAIMQMTAWIIKLMPIAIWGFVTLFFRDMRNGLDAKTLALYLFCVLAANVIQAMVVLPALLKSKGISPLHVFRGMMPALSVAFFTKSSSAALPMAMKCAEERVGVSSQVAGFSLPLCTTINMNACAAFILTTVLFVSMSNGMTYSTGELVGWVVVATIAAVGNAGVPMGCYFLSSALLAAMDMPLTLMGVILPFYSLIDMLESAINVWSDACVTTVVDAEVTADALELRPA